MTELSQHYKDLGYGVHLRIKALIEQDPDALSYAIGQLTGQPIDVSTMNEFEVTSSIFGILSQISGEDAHLLKDKELFTMYLPEPSPYKIPTMALPDEVRSYRSGIGCTDPSANNYDPTATVDNGLCEYGTGSGSGYGNCDCDNYTYAANSPCYEECSWSVMDYCYDPTACNYGFSEICDYGCQGTDGNGDDDDCGAFWCTFFPSSECCGGDGVEVDIPWEELPFDSIKCWLFPDSCQTPTQGGCPTGKYSCKKDGVLGCYSLAECDKDDTGTDWTKIALIGGAVLVVGLGLYFGLRKRR
tara:strand:- start:4677 stop:5576 length:900 start_codon:yes stop_codon:yes gene_type:complete